MKKYIWTFWTTPHGYKIDLRELIYLSLSVESIKKISNNCVIYTDTRGAKEIDNVGLECEKVILNFDQSIGNKKYNIGQARLITMSMQESEFCHLDSDVFIFSDIYNDPFYNLSKDFDLTVQSFEAPFKWGYTYQKNSEILKENESKIPEELKILLNEDIYAGYNCGYLDIKNLSLLDEWLRLARGIYRNFNLTNKYQNIVANEMLLYAICRKNKYNVQLIVPNEILLYPNKVQENLFDSFSYKDYMHLMNYKEGVSIACNNSCEGMREVLKKLRNINSSIYQRFIEINPKLTLID